MFAASVDDPDINGKFARDIGVDYPILSDPSRAAAKAYGVARDDKALATRWTFYIGIDGKILYVDRQVSPSAHGGAVAAKLAELGVKRRTPVRPPGALEAGLKLMGQRNVDTPRRRPSSSRDDRRAPGFRDLPGLRLFEAA